MPQPLTLAQRGVWIDRESLADMLKAKGLAKDYDGEGARLEVVKYCKYPKSLGYDAD